MKDAAFIQRLKQRIDYNPKTGDLTYRQGSLGKRWGEKAGTVDKDGRTRVGFEKKIYAAADIAWAIFFGEWPSGVIMFADRDPANFRIENLQIARKNTGQKLDQNLVKELFDYDPETGKLTYKMLSPTVSGKIGDEVKSTTSNTIKSKKYKRVSINGEAHLQHRIIWLWWYGYLPENNVDHINKDPLDNRLCNLREISTQCNIRNSKLSKNNTSGVSGVCPTNTGKYEAYIKINFLKKGLGRFNDFAEAVAHRLAAEQCVNWEGCDSTSSAFQYMKNYISRKENVDV